MQQAFIVGVSKFFFGFPRKKTKLESKMSDRYPVRDPHRIYLRTKHREGGNEVVFSLAIKNTTLIQWHKLKKETPSISYINMLNEIIPGHALKIRAQLFKGRLALAWG